MGFIGWTISILALLAGLALRQDRPVGGSDAIAMLLLALAFVACPLIWRDQPLGISRGQRIAAALALVLTLPAILLPA